MSNISISELDTTASTLENDDLLLVSKKNGDSFTSAKLPGSVLKSGGTQCSFSSDAVKTACKTAIDEKNVSTLTTDQVQTACSSAIDGKSLSTLTTSDIKTQCENAITGKGVSTLTETQVQIACTTAVTSSTTSVNVKGIFIDPSKFEDGYLQRQDNLSNYTLLYDSVVTMWIDYNPTGNSTAYIKLYCSGGLIGEVLLNSSNSIANNSGSQSFYLKKGSSIKIDVQASASTIQTKWSICPLG